MDDTALPGNFRPDIFYRFKQSLITINSKVPHSKLWGITGRGSRPTPSYEPGRFPPPSKLGGIQRSFL